MLFSASHFGSRSTWAIGLGSLVLTLAAAAVHAQLVAVTLPAMKGEGAARYACGGIGSDESTAMRAAMRQHPLSLLFTTRSGDYLADIDVTIKQAGGATALTLRADGPMCMIDLPPGRYTVQVAAAGHLVPPRQAVSVGKGTKALRFAF